jgi:hypothetical protein
MNKPVKSDDFNIFKAKGIKDLHNAFKGAEDRDALICNAEYSDRTAVTIADNTMGVNPKTHLVLSCEGIKGYLGCVIINPKLDSKEYSTATLYHFNWQVSRCQFNWYELRSGKYVHQYTRIRQAPKGTYWRILRIQWEPGLPADDDYDIQCDSWIKNDLRPYTAT